VRIDHVIYATDDLDTAQRRFESFGLRVVPGGVHDGMGTHNRIVPLGVGYVELLAVHDGELAAGAGFGQALLDRLQDGEGWLGWAVAVDEDLERVAQRLGVSIIPISRDGLTARLAGVAEAAKAPFLPFFCQRDHGIQRPGDGGSGGISWLELGGDADTLADWLGGAELPLRFADGPPRPLAVGVGDLELRG
jgi:catechol 2,3-dioxygenase-like lactoylglutathione lyase family enzyme